MRTPRILAGAALMLALAASACTNGSSTLAGGADLSPSPRTPISLGSPTQEPSETSSPTPAPEIEDGRHFVFVRRARGGDVTFDLAEFYTGDQANQIAGERGDEVPVPNDVYIVNDNPKLRTVPVGDDPKILLLKWSQCCDVFVGVSYDAFAGYLVAPTDDFHGTSSPYWIRVQGGQIVKIQEQYLP